MATQEEIDLISGAAEPQVEEQVVVNEDVVVDEPLSVAALKEKPVEELSDTEAETLAADMGWRADFDGPKKRSAKEFLELGQRHAPQLLKENKKLAAEKEALIKYAESITQTSAEAVKRVKEESTKRIAELEAAKTRAREDLDIDAFEAASEEQHDLTKEVAALDKKTTAPQIHPLVQIWATENADFMTKVNSDPILSTFADSLSISMRDELMQLPPQDRLDRIKNKVMEEMPHKFQNANQQQAPKTLSLNRTPAMTKPKDDKLSIATLPKEAKEGYELIVKAQRFKSDDQRKAFEERYLQNYKTMS